MTNTPTLDLAELERLAREANPRGWLCEPFDGCFVFDNNGDFLAECNTAANALYIAAASPDTVVALIERLRTLEAERDQAIQDVAIERDSTLKLVALENQRDAIIRDFAIESDLLQDDVVRSIVERLSAAAVEQRDAFSQARVDTLADALNAEGEAMAYDRGYAKGRADERADVVAWFQTRAYSLLPYAVQRIELIRNVKAGEHVRSAKEGT